MRRRTGAEVAPESYTITSRSVTDSGASTVAVGGVKPFATAGEGYTDVNHRIVDFSQRLRQNTLSRFWRRVALIVGLTMVALVALRVQRMRTPQSGEHPIVKPRSEFVGAASDLAALTLLRIVRTDSFTDQSYTIEALQRLSTALDIAMRRDTVLHEHKMVPGELREVAWQMERMESPSEFSPMVRKAFVAAAGVLSELQQRRYPHLKRIVTQLQSLAVKIQPDRDLASQRSTVDEFFELASDALTAMAEARG